MISVADQSGGRIVSAANWLTRPRIRAQAIVLALCLWGVCAVDYATPGLFDRAGNVKFQDFLVLPISARLIAQGRTSELYDNAILAREIRSIVGRDTNLQLQYFYGPQVALPFLPFVHLPFMTQAVAWVALSLAIYLLCLYLIWKTCPALHKHEKLVAICAIAYPPLFHFFVRGQLSALVLLCFTAAYLAFRARREWLAGAALGLLIFKPQFLVAIPLILLVARAWKPFIALILSAVVQLTLSLLYFGPAVMRTYFNMLMHSAARPETTELNLSQIQMHSLQSFWELLVPWPHAVWPLYILSSLAVVAIAATTWRSSLPLSLRYSSLILAAILLNTHLFIYDLLALSPAIMLTADWTLTSHRDRTIATVTILTYLAAILPLFGPLARWTHLQLSVPVFCALLYGIHSHTQKMTRRGRAAL